MGCLEAKILYDQWFQLELGPQSLSWVVYWVHEMDSSFLRHGCASAELRSGIWTCSCYLQSQEKASVLHLFSHFPSEKLKHLKKQHTHLRSTQKNLANHETK